MENNTSGALEADSYALNRDWLASSRLSVQHFIMKLRSGGWLLHPKVTAEIDATTTTPLRIGDIVAGNGVWSLDLLSERPTAEITAFDISTAQFPRPDCCPPNLRFETWDIFTPPPPKYHNYFDVIHIAFAIAIFPNGGQDRVIQHLLQLLKSGGWLQWHDVEPPSLSPIHMNTLKPVPRTQWPMQIHFVNTLMGGIWEKMEWFHKLDQVLADGGFSDTELHRPPVKRELLKLEDDLVRFFFDEFVSHISIKLAESEEGREKIKEVREAMGKEWDAVQKGEKVWCYLYIVAIGRKPGGGRSASEVNS